MWHDTKKLTRLTRYRRLAILVFSLGFPAQCFASPCFCFLFPVFNAGNYHLYLVERYEDCSGSPNDCTSPTLIYQFGLPGIPPQNCAIEGQCQGDTSALNSISAPELRLATPMPAEFDLDYPSTIDPTIRYRALFPDDRAQQVSQQDFSFKNPHTGEPLNARAFVIKAKRYAVPEKPSDPLPHTMIKAACGCEFEDPDTSDNIVIKDPKPVSIDGNVQKHLFEIEHGSVTYLVLTCN